MDPPSFGDLWQQEEFSDCEVLLTAAEATLARFPGHNVILSRSPFFAAQVLRWQRKRPHEGTEAQDVQQQHDSSSTQPGAQASSYSSGAQLVLELQDASEQEAALAVLSSMYLIRPLPELLAGLTQEQQLQAALLADQWQVPRVSSAAAMLLADVVNTPGGLAEAVKQRLLAAEAVPDCLQPVLKDVLLPLLGELEAAWANEGLQEQLLGLSLPAMELLLSCNELKVASEDTVLYTLQRYLDSCNEAQRQHARQVLAPLVRCQHLSQFWLATTVVSTQPTLALAELRPQLGLLLVLRSVQPGAVVQPARAAGDRSTQLGAGAASQQACRQRVGHLEPQHRHAAGGSTALCRREEETVPAVTCCDGSAGRLGLQDIS